MAKRTKSGKNKVDGEMDFDDLDDLGGDMDFGELEDIDGSERKPSKIGVAKDLAKEAGTGFLDGLVRKTASKSLPEEYSTHYSDTMDYVDFAKTTFEQNKSKVAKTSYQLGKEVKKILPFQLKMLDNFLERYESDNIQAQQQSEEQMRDASIQSNISGIFDKQLEMQKAIEAKRDAENEIDKKQRISMAKLNMDVLTSIDNNISTQTAFTLQISKEYFRRSLELQFKSYFVQADMLKTMRDYYKGFSIQFESIAKNTGLPEFVKLNNSERIADEVRRQMVQSTYRKVFSNSEYVNRVKANIGKMISDKVSAVTDKVDAVTDQLAMINSATEGMGGGAVLAGGIAAGMAGDTAGGELGDKWGGKLREKLKDHKGLNAGAKYLSTLANSPSTFFGSMRSKTGALKEKYQDESNPVRYLASKLFGGLDEMLSVTDPGRTEYKVQGASALNHNKPAIFDNKVHRSITEVIPMYLAKILSENSNLKSMYSVVNADKLGSFKGSEELHYDYDERKLVTKGDLVKGMEDRYLSKQTNKNKLSSTANVMLGNSLSALGKDKKANKKDIDLLSSKKAKDLMSTYLATASKDESLKFNYKTLVEEATTDKASPTVAKMISENPELGQILNILKKTKDGSKMKWTNAQLYDVKNQYPVSGVKELFSGASKLAGSKSLNYMKDPVAEVISKAFTRFITDSGRDIIIDNIVSGEAFKHMTEDEFEVAKPHITIFINETKKIQLSGDILQEGTFVSLLGFVNSSLKDNFELDPEVFQTLYELNPTLGKKGRLTEENLVERKLFGSTERSYVRTEDLRQVVKASTSDVKDLRARQENKNMLDTLSDRFDGLKTQHLDRFNDDYKNAKNPLEKAKVALKYLKEASSKAKELAKEQANKTTKQVSELSKAASDLMDKGINTGIQKLIQTLEKTEVSLDSMIKTETAAFEEDMRKLEETKSQLGDVINDSKALKEVDKEIDTLKKLHKTEIDTITELKKLVTANKNKLKTWGNTNTSVKSKELVAKIKADFSELLVKLKDLSKKHEERKAAATA